MMKRSHSSLLVSSLLALVLLCAVPAQAAAEGRLIVRAGGLLGGLPVVTSACRILGCKVLYTLDGTLNNLVLVSVPDGLDLTVVTNLLSIVPGIVDVEVDQTVWTEGSGTGTEPPAALLDKEIVEYYGTPVRRGYITQPAFNILGLDEAHDRYGLTGRGITVAVIDTGADTNHPVLANVLVSGYDFTRNREGGGEQGDISQSTMTVLDDARPGFVNQSTMTVLDQSTMTVLDSPEYAAFGHGTMVAGVIHLAAPRAKIMPLKAFRADGSGYASDVLRAIYMASNRGAKVINMSFSFSYKSRELERALDYATAKGAIAVSSAGNDGKRVNKYPASLPTVMGVASTTDWDTLSAFSNFGTTVAWIAAPGEAIVTTYPFSTWAASWGTSFSTPFAAGTAAMLAESAGGAITNTQAADAEGNAVWVSYDVRKGRLHAPTAIRAWKKRTSSSLLGLW
jgi:subtilisin family serine protease